MDTYKIAFVFDDSLDKTDGVQQYVLTLGKWLSSKGHDVHYIVGETKRTDLPNVHSLGKNVKVRFNQNRLSIPLPVSNQRIRELLEREEFDILHIQMPYSPALGGRVIKNASPLTGVVGTFHIAPASWFVRLANRMLYVLSLGTLSRVDEIMSVSEVAQDFAYDTYRFESAVVPNTLRLNPFYEGKALKAYKDVTTIMFFGRLVERKGCHLFLRSIKRLKEEHGLPVNARVVICGTGPMETQLKRYVKDNGLTKLVEFVGFVAEEEKPHYLASADILIYPSTGGESFGIVLLEGMAASRGVVLAGNNPGYASVVGERPEILFNPLSDVQLSRKIQKFLDDPKARIKMRDYQRQFVGKFDVANVADEVLIVYEQALHKRRS